MSPLRDALAAQARACAALGSPFTARLMSVLADVIPEGPLGDRLKGWTGDLGPRGASVPLRLAGALHALVLSGRAPPLAAIWPPRDAGDAELRDAVAETLATEAPFVDRFIDGPPQTNEVARAAVLIAALHHLAPRGPVTLSELGASAGLNLHLDSYALQAGTARLGPADAALTLAPRWAGPVPAPAPASVADRRGVDLSPIDVADPDAQLRLRAYLWADQPERRARLDRALALPPAPVDRGDAAAWLADRLAHPRPGLHLVYHTIAWQYFPEATQGACRAALEAAGARATPEAPLAWLGVEADDDPHGAAVSLRLWRGDRPGGEARALGRADFHGRWVEWV